MIDSFLKWKEWADNHWVLITDSGEVVDEITRDSKGFFVIKSTGKKFIDLRKAKDARPTAIQSN